MIPAFLVLIGLILVLEALNILPRFIRGGTCSFAEGEELTVTGQVYRKEQKTGSVAVYLRHATILLSGGQSVSSPKLILVSDTDTYSMGATLMVQGTPSLFTTPRNEGNFNELSFYRARKVGYRFFPNEIQILKSSQNPFWILKEKLFQLSRKVSAIYDQEVSSCCAGILKAMVLGDKSTLQSEVKDRFRNNGISHVLAISGLHVSILGLSLYELCRKKFKFGFSCSIAAISLILYYLMVGGNSSIFRAAIMCGLLLLANYLGRTYDPSSALSLAGILLLLQSPYMVWDAGFQLSVSAILGTIFMSVYLYTYYEDMPWWKKSLLMGLSIQLVTLPLVAFHYYEVPLFGLLVNLVVLPLIAPVLVLAVVGGLLSLVGVSITSLVGMIGIPAGFIGILLLKGADLILTLLVKIPKLPVLLCGKPSLWQLILYYCILCMLAYLLLYRGQYRYLWMMVPSLCLLYLPMNRDPQLVMLDVGQGDGIYLTDGRGMDCMIDGGSTTVEGVGTYRILPFLKSRRIRSIDYWFVSHGDSDHISGLLEILASGYPVDTLVLSDKMPQDDAYESLIAAARESNTKILVTEKNHVLQNDFIALTNLTPGGADPLDRNTNCMVLYLTTKWGRNALLAGDITSEEEEKLVAESKDLKLTYVKANHHGSKYSNSLSYLAAYHAKICLISAGEGNPYGHPHQEALDRMREEGLQIIETQNQGEIICPLD